jgi:hypothetical protein
MSSSLRLVLTLFIALIATPAPAAGPGCVTWDDGVANINNNPEAVAQMPSGFILTVEQTRQVNEELGLDMPAGAVVGYLRGSPSDDLAFALIYAPDGCFVTAVESTVRVVVSIMFTVFGDGHPTFHRLVPSPGT